MDSESDSVRKNSEAYHKALTSRFTKRTRQIPSNTIHAQAYQYQPLRDPRAYIRLLYLLPRSCVSEDQEGMLRCELMTFCIDEAPQYAGLSYTWGDPTRCRQIIVGRNTLRITQSLANALEHLQEQDKTIVLWADAICINQEDNAEKSAQVQLMGKIYMFASVVLVWLGPSIDESQIPTEWITKKHTSHTLEALLKASAADIKTSYPLSVMRKFIDRPWFSRVWVMQEVALNTEVIFVYSASDFTKTTLLRAMVLTTLALEHVTQEFCPFHFLRFYTRQPMPLVQFIDSAFTQSALWLGKYLQSSEPRDFVFSLFGMISDIERYQLVVDYSKTIEEIYTDFTVAIVKATGLKHLSRIWCRSSKYVELPSWVPDWSATYATARLPKYEIPGANAKVHLTNEGNWLLRTYALRIAKIEAVEYGYSGVDANSVISQEELYWFLSKLSKALSFSPGICKAKKIDRTVYKMSIATSYKRWYIADTRENELYHSYLAFRGLVKAPGNVEDTVTWQAETSVPYLSALQSSGNSRYIFTTSNGIVGWAAHKIEVGDLLFLFYDTEGFWIVKETKPGRHCLMSLATISGYKHPARIDEKIEVIDIY